MSSTLWMQQPNEGTERSNLSGQDQSSNTEELTTGAKIRLAFRVVALALGGMMVISAFLELVNLSGTNGFREFFISLYNLLFAAVLILYEVQGFSQCERVDSTMRHYFGLVYGHLGRAIFIIFIAFLNFALSDAGALPWFTGLGLLALGGCMILIFFKYPHLLDDQREINDTKTQQPSRQGYAPPPTMPSTDL
ncbi:unnamed protein product [Choristocarpus tenellus]